MLWNVALAYLAGWVIVAIGVFVAGKFVSEPDMPLGGRLVLSVAAGAIWPLLLIAAVQFTSVAMYKTAEHYAASKINESLPLDAEPPIADVIHMR